MIDNYGFNPVAYPRERTQFTPKLRIMLKKFMII